MHSLKRAHPSTEIIIGNFYYRSCNNLFLILFLFRCVQSKALNCKAAIAHITNKNTFKIMNEAHTHPVITTRRKPGEFKALMKARQEKMTSRYTD